MAPNEKQKIEIEKTHRDTLLSFNQAVTVDCSDFLGTALTRNMKKAYCKPSLKGLGLLRVVTKFSAVMPPPPPINIGEF